MADKPKEPPATHTGWESKGAGYAQSGNPGAVVSRQGGDRDDGQGAEHGALHTRINVVACRDSEADASTPDTSRVHPGTLLMPSVCRDAALSLILDYLESLGLTKTSQAMAMELGLRQVVPGVPAVTDAQLHAFVEEYRASVSAPPPDRDPGNVGGKGILHPPHEPVLCVRMPRPPTGQPHSVSPS
eukprot:jgi/Mesvir1/3140/Mv16311-RA.1